MVHPVHHVEVICRRNLAEAVLEEDLPFHTHSLQLPLRRQVPHLLLVMGLEHSLPVMEEALETAFHILLVQKVVQVRARDRHMQGLTDFCHNLRVHQVPRIGQDAQLAGKGCHSLEGAVHVLLPSYPRQLLLPLRPLAYLPFRSRPSHAYLVRLFHNLEVDIPLVLYHCGNLVDP